jgi:hydrogenase nickel incorporation protein HypA/HybF
MHELAICQSMLEQIEAIARKEQASSVTRILLRIGPLSGVVPELLEQAFTIARSGSVAEQAELVTENEPIRVHCDECGAESVATPSNLTCSQCGGFRTRLLSGDELLLASLELERDTPKENEPQPATLNGA